MEIIDVFKRKEALSEVFEKKYLGDVIAKNGKNTSNIKERTNRGQGTINKLVTTLNERSYGRHQFKAAMLMRGAMLVGGMLNNAEFWINITQKDLENLKAPDIILLKKILSTKGSPSKCFIQLELGIIPIRFILKQKRLNFLHYILNEDKNSMISQVFFEMKKDRRMGNFISLIEKDKLDLEITKSYNEIEEMTKISWKKYVKEKVTNGAFKYLVEENVTIDKTKHITFSDLKMGQYLTNNKKTSVTKIIFHTRSKTLEIKVWAHWEFKNDWSVTCKNVIAHHIKVNHIVSEAM